MAIVTSPLMHGARGRVDGVVFRQRFGSTVASARPAKRSKKSITATQQAQMSAFSLANELCNLMPLWARRAFTRVGARSSWNIAVSTLTKAVKSGGIPVDSLPKFSTFLAVLSAVDARTSHGEALDLVHTVADASLLFTAPVAGRLYVFIDGEKRFPNVVYYDIEAGKEQTVPVTTSAMWLFLTADGIAATSYASECIIKL